MDGELRVDLHGPDIRAYQDAERHAVEQGPSKR